MALKVLLGPEKAFCTIVVLLAYLVREVICETGDCRQQEYRDGSGNCVLCKQCGPGMELSKECGFGYGEDAQCATCRPHRFKEDWGFQKCKPCLECAAVNRFQKANCSATSDAVCGDCLPGFYRKTKLVGFQDMECVPCGDPPPPYEPHCTSKVNLVKIPSTASSPRDTALAAVICSALATVLLALLILCVIYCKRQFVEKKPSYLNSADLLPEHVVRVIGTRPRPAIMGFWTAPDNPRLILQTPSAAGSPDVWIQKYHRGNAVSFSVPRVRRHGKQLPHSRHTGPVGETMPTFFGSLSRSVCGEFSDAWPLMQNPICGDDLSFCDSYPELTGEDIRPLDPEDQSSSSSDSNGSRDLVGGAVPIQGRSGNSTGAPDLSGPSASPTEPAPTQDAPSATSQLHQEGGDMSRLSPQMSLQ